MLRRRRLSQNMKRFIKLLDDHYDKESKKPLGERNIYPPPTNAQLVVDCLTDLILGDDWYIPDPVTTGQVNTYILDQILYKYCKEYRNLPKKKSNK